MGLEFHQGLLGRSQTTKQLSPPPPLFPSTVPKQNYSPIIQRGSVCLQEEKCKEPSAGVSGCKFTLFPAILPSSQDGASRLHPGLPTFPTHPIFTSFLLLFLLNGVIKAVGVSQTSPHPIPFPSPWRVRAALTLLNPQFYLLLLNPIYPQPIPWHEPDCKHLTHIKPPQ